ncbi:DUF6383 domain-containing protein [uncultured Parabacteroides sp.]|jgi:hypothetical protein|uniref:DUF6383 domain-containing protein n=1 Tax=uncultured Parabacteroides sp. TaxID=512312 RepID=UPI0025D4FA33|nr:DUF6383 domain-containing protein [uncultured Parabacteroides sp.]
MNKKFSTLVAALLASGGLFYAVDAMILPAGDGVAQYVTAVALTNEAGEFTGYTFDSETFAAGTSCIWKMVATTDGHNLTASASGEAAYYLAADANGALVMQAKADGALIFTLNTTTGKLTTADGKVLSIADGVLSLEAAGSSVAAAGLFGSDAAAVTTANTQDGFALGTIVSTQEVVDLTTDSKVLNWKAAVDSDPAALDGLKNLTSTSSFDAQEKWDIASKKIKATNDVLLTAGVDAAAPTLGSSGTEITLEADGAIKLGSVWLKITSDGIVCSTDEPADAEKAYLYSAVGTVVKTTTDASGMVISTLTTADGESENVTGTVAIIAATYATPADNLPGLDNATVDTDGKVTAVTPDAGGKLTVAAPFYFKDENYVSVVTDEDGNYVIATEEKDLISEEPTAAQSARASWRLEGSKLISVASERAGKTVALATTTTTKAAAATYVTVPVADAPTVEISTGGAIKFTQGSATATAGALYVSATPQKIDGSVYTSGGIVVGGTQKSNDQKLYAGVPSGYALVGVLQADGNMEYLYAATNGTVSTETFDGSDYKGYLWKVSETNDNDIAYYYTFTSLQIKDGKAIQWTMADGTAQLTGMAKYDNGVMLSHKTGNITEDGEAVDGGTNAVIGFYEAPMGLVINSKLDAILNPGFEMTIAIEKDSKDVLENSDIFSGKIYQKETSTGSSTYVLWDNKNAKDAEAKMLVLNKAKISGDNAVGTFAWVSQKEYDKDQAGDKNYVNTFKFMYDLSNPTTNVIAKMMVGSYTVSVLEVDKKFYLTSVKTVTDKTKLPYIELGANNIYPVKELLGKLWNITYADTKANANKDDEAYKLNGILAVSYDKDGVQYVWNKEAQNSDGSKGAWEVDAKDPTSVADYVSSSTVAESAPEAQWMVTKANLSTNTFTLTNRENPNVKITGVQLRVRDNDKFEVYITPEAKISGVAKYSTSESNLKGDYNDIVYLTESVKKDNFQGYMHTTENTLRSNNYFLGQYHAIGGNHNAYFIENHNNSHQIGAVADQEEADKWKLHFAMKKDDDNKYTKVDTVYVITEYATLNKDKNGFLAAGHKDVKKDTLAILPYAFQKVSNREFVTFDETPKFNFYACDEDNKDDANDAIRFALKVKPNGYNFVEITGTEDNAVLSSDKMYLANSAENGSLERMQTYAPDNNSVMVVEAADASEYHKIAIEWGDTISLFRDENNSQVLYEKRDAKSVVEKDTLSFLNIDNINQFSVNPAIFADTAYINRWDADGVLNTTYQYLLTLNPSFGLHTEDCEIPGHDPIIGGIDTVYGRFLVNLIDTANVYGVNHIHNNWYINSNEAGEKRAKLSFVEGFHTNDTLYVTRQGGETVKIGMTDPAFNVAKFAFRYVDSDAKTFKIQTQYKEYLGDDNRYETAEEFAKAYANGVGEVSNEGYLKWINGTLVVEKGYENGDVFGIEENVKRAPVANEDVTVSSISVIASEGAVTINGAAGKKVTISNVLGQTIANTVLSSDNASIAAPAGVVVVAVEGEAAVKAIVK